MTCAGAVEAVEACEAAGITLAVNQNMRYDPSVRAAKRLVEQGELGEAVLATIELRGIPHWMPWQAEMGWVTLRTLSIHHLDCFRYWFGDPDRIYCSVRSDPRTTFPHTDGIASYILEYAGGLRCIAIDDTWAGPAKEGCPADAHLTWRIDGLNGLAIGDIGWVKTPFTPPSSIRYAVKGAEAFRSPPLAESWFPDAFAGPMGELLVALESDTLPVISGRDNLTTVALLEAAYRRAETHRAIALDDVIGPETMPVAATPRFRPSTRLEVAPVERRGDELAAIERCARLAPVVESPRRSRPKTGLTAQLSRTAMQAIECAGVACDLFGHSAIGTEHLLLGLAEQSSAPVAGVLRQAGITLPLLERAVESEVGRNSSFQRIDPPGLKPLVKRVLELATSEAESAGATVAGPEPMLLAMMRNDEGVGARVLNQLGVSVEMVERAVRLEPQT